MPPRKRRQSAQGDDLVREIGERDTASLAVGTDYGRRTAVKGADVAERRSVRQAVKQDSQEEGPATDGVGSSITPPPSVADQSTTGRQPTRFSTRIVKRPRRDLSPPESPVKKAGRKTSVSVTASTSDGTGTVTTPETKSKRQWELWSVEDKDSFFEGLCEYGKDFESIHNLIVSKCKKKITSLPMTVKNKEQVRHFYYRTWHKISKLIQPVTDLKKDIQELYGLISYSVLRKKLRGGVNPSDKNWQKLNDLVHQGVATIKVKGKRIRVKTPVCAALKKLNSYEEPKREPGPKVPEKIRLEFRAKTNAAWQHVQDQAHNPRVRVSVRPDRHLQSLVKYLDNKWKAERVKKREKLNVSEEAQRVFRVYPCGSSTLRHVNLEPIDEPVLQFCLNKHCKDAPSNTCSPSTGKRRKDAGKTTTASAFSSSTSDMYIDLAKPVITPLCQCTDTCTMCSLRENSVVSTMNSLTDNPGNPVNKSGLTCTCACNKDGPSCRKALHTFEQTDGTTADSGLTSMSLFGSAILESQINKKSADEQRKHTCSTQKTDGSDVSSRIADKQTLITSKRSAVNDVSSIVDGENAMFPDMMVELCQPDGDCDTLGTRTSDHTSPGKEKPQTDMNGEPNSFVQETDVNKTVKSSQQELEQRFKHMLEVGWGPGEDCQVTMAELYLMFGGNGELRFEYEWVGVDTLQMSQHMTLQQALLCNLNNMLRRLSHLATMEITDFNKTGPSETCTVCGHNPAAKQKGKVRSPTSKSSKTGRDISTQTFAAPDVNIPMLAGLVSTNQNGLFRVPVLPPVNQSIQPKPATKTTQSTITREMLQKYNPANLAMAKPQVRRRLKPIARTRGGLSSANNLVQRTILPKNSEYITIIPMIPGAQLPASPTQPAVSIDTSQPAATVTQTFVGHPLNGIHTQSIAVSPNSPPVTTVAGLPVSNIPATDYSGVMRSPEAGNTSFSLSAGGDETLLRIPESHLGMMSPRSLKAAGMSAIRDTSQPGVPITMITQAFSQLTSTPVMVTTSSTSPPGNTSNILDISLLSAGDLSLSCLLDESNSGQRGLSLDPGLVTPPIRNVDPADVPRGNTEGAVRSLFTPTPDTHWLNGEAPDLSLTSFLESPSKPITQSSSSSVFNTMSLFNENSRDFHTHKLEVDSTLQSMMTESSIDYVKKFADLAEQIAQTDPQTSKPDTANK